MDEHKNPGTPRTDFIRQIVAGDVASGKHGGTVVTRFPPEPNGYLHLGHAKSICLNFGIAQEFGGRCHLRYDDTNPETEQEEFAVSMRDDIRWLGFDWGEHLYYASDYFERMYECALVLIRKGLAYVDSQSAAEIRERRGTVTEAGVPSPFRDRSVEENLALFAGMRAGDFVDGEHVLRAKADMTSPNMLMRDPVLYRIRHAEHYRQGDAWCIYPLYDYAHCLEDAFEGVTHSLCTLEFENNRELYDWVLDNVGFEEPRTHQFEFAELALENAVLSKRKIIPLVEAGIVSGWDDPRLSTIRGMRRRGVPPESLRAFCEMVGVAKSNSTIDAAKFEFQVRDHLNRSAPRVMAVLDPLRVVISNFAEDRTEQLDAPYFPHDVPLEGSRTVPFGRELYIERSDFAEDPPKGFRRLIPGGEVRLRYAYVIRCVEVVKAPSGDIVELRCTYDPDTRGGALTDGRRVQGTVQWLSAPHALEAEVRLYDRLFLDAEIDTKIEAEVDAASGLGPNEAVAERGIVDLVNPEALVIISGARVEPSIAADPPDTRYQFERTGYFWRDPVDGVGERLVFNRIVTLKDTWAKSGGQDALGGTEAKPPPAGGLGDTPGAPEPGERPHVSEERAAARAGDSALAARYERYRTEMSLTDEDADLLTESSQVSDFFEAALATHPDPATVTAWMVNDVRGALSGRSLGEASLTGSALGSLIALVDSGVVSRRAAKDVLARLVDEGGDPLVLVQEMGLETLGDGDALSAIIDAALAEWPDKVEEYRAGRRGLLGMFVGQVMKASGGAADPKSVKLLLEERLSR